MKGNRSSEYGIAWWNKAYPKFYNQNECSLSFQSHFNSMCCFVVRSMQRINEKSFPDRDNNTAVKPACLFLWYKKEKKKKGMEKRIVLTSSCTSRHWPFKMCSIETIMTFFFSLGSLQYLGEFLCPCAYGIDWWSFSISVSLKLMHRYDCSLRTYCTPEKLTFEYIKILVLSEMKSGKSYVFYTIQYNIIRCSTVQYNAI